MTHMTRTMTVMTAAFTLLVAGAAAFGVFNQPATVQAKAASGSQAPVFTLKDTAGQTHNLSDYAGKTVVLHWQSMRCPWDVGYQPMLSKMAEDYAEKDVVFLAINSNQRELKSGELSAYHADEAMPYPILEDPGASVADAYGAQVTPHMYVIDGTGKLVYQGGVEAAPRSPSDAGRSDKQYLAAVLAAVSAGESSPYDVTKPKGCGIKR